MYWWVAIIAAVLTVMFAGTIYLQSRYVHFDKAANALQSLATAAALMFAGYWFLYERKGLPQANTRLEVVGLKVTDGAVALEARFAITNLGTTLLSVGKADVRLQQMNADSMPIAKLLALKGTEFPDYIDKRDAYDDGVLMWPTIRWFRGGSDRNIEPGETDLRIVDTVASCDNTALRLQFMMLPVNDSEQVWSDQATLSMAELCGKPVGTKEVWSNATSGR